MTTTPTLRVHPFDPLLAFANRVAQVAAPAYDTIDEAEARAIVAARPLSFLRVTRPEVSFPPGTSTVSRGVLAAGRSALEEMIRNGLLRPEGADRILLYRLAHAGHRQTGVVCCCEVADYDQGRILRHEHTRHDKERERVEHAIACRAHTEAVLLAHRDDLELEDLVRRDTNDRPRFHFVGPDGVTHTLWSVARPEPYVAAFARMPQAWICDGHHRASAASIVARQLPDEPGARRFPAVLFPLSHLRILPYHRLVRDLAGMTAAQLLAALETVGQLQSADRGDPGERGRVGVYLDGRWWHLTLDPMLLRARDPGEALDVSALQRLVLGPLLGIEDPRSDGRISFVGGTRGTEALRQAVDSGAAAVAFAMHPTSMLDLLSVVEAGEVMPPKSTWFAPKLASGLFVHPFDPIAPQR